MSFGDPSPTDTDTSEGVIFTVRDFYGRYIDTIAAAVVLFILCWDGKSPAPITVLLKILHLLLRLMTVS